MRNNSLSRTLYIIILCMCNFDRGMIFGFSSAFDAETTERFSRQLLLPEIGVDGQRRIMESRILIVGAGGLGCPVALYLAAAGIGHLTIVDFDEVELSNCHRQVLHSRPTHVCKTNKAASLASILTTTLGHAENISVITKALDSENAMELISSVDIVVDCSDNIGSRYLINDVCVQTGKTLVCGSALKLEGQISTFNYSNESDSPCYRCIFPIPTPPEFVDGCSDVGVLGPITGIIGNLQALETIKVILGFPSI